MENYKKIMLSFVFCFTLLLLSNTSQAMPDLYFFSNFLAGQSPYYYTGSADNTNLYYYPNDGTDNTNQGFVTSFSTQFMNGNEEKNYVEAVNLDYTSGKIFELPANSCLVTYSGSGQTPALFSYGDFYAISLGTNSFNSIQVGTMDNKIYRSSDISADNLATGSIQPYSFLEWDTIVPGQTYHTGNSVLTTYGGSNINHNITEVYFLINLSEESCFFTTESQYSLTSSSIPTYDAPFTSVDDVSMLITGFAATHSSTYPYYILPHIKADLDIYSHPYTISPNDVSYQIRTGFNYRFSISDTIENVLFFEPLGGSYVNTSASSINLAFNNPDSSLIPFFLNSTSIKYLYDKAIYIKDGYVNVQNYEELVALLKDQGIGQADLTRVVELLTELNTGGASGEEVKELIGILESYHDQLINQANFGELNNVFEQYKHILDFSNDMHWLITANNALFGYFAGFIMLSALFLILNRILR